MVFTHQCESFGSCDFSSTLVQDEVRAQSRTRAMTLETSLPVARGRPAALARPFLLNEDWRIPWSTALIWHVTPDRCFCFPLRLRDRHTLERACPPSHTSPDVELSELHAHAGAGGGNNVLFVRLGCPPLWCSRSRSSCLRCKNARAHS